MKQSGSSDRPPDPRSVSPAPPGRHHGTAGTGSGLIRSLTQLRPQASGARRARQAANVADLLGLCRTLTLRPGKRAGESRCQLTAITGCSVRRNPHEDTSAHEQIFGRETVDSASGPASPVLTGYGRRAGSLGPGLTSGSADAVRAVLGDDLPAGPQVLRHPPALPV